MKIDQILAYRDMCNVCGQTPCNCTHVAESQLNEFAPGNGDDREPNEEEILRQLASHWWSGTEQQMAQAQRTLETLGWEIGPDESGDEDAGVYVYRIGDDDGRDTIAFSHSELSLDEAKKKKKSSRSLRGYFFPGYAYYGSGESGEGGGDGVGESINRGVAEGLSDTQKKIEDTILKLEQRLKFAKTPEQWDNIKNRIERLQAGLNRSKQGVAEGDLNEFAPGGDSASSYYAVTANFVNEFAQQKQEELQDLIDAGWTKQDLAQAGTLKGQAADIAHFERVRDRFLKGLKPGFDAYLRGDTQLKDQLGAYWLENDLPLNQDWEKIYGEPWGDDGLDEGDVTHTPTGLIHRAKDKYGAGEEPFSPVNPGKYARDLDHVNKQQVKDLDASMGITWKNRGTKGVEVDESKPKEKEADYGADYQDMVARVKKLAGLGPLKTVYDPKKRVYRNMPTAVQPKK